ncbi:MAG: AAA family ATPase [Mariprofundales bacterium]
MYQSYFGFKSLPFSIAPDPRYLYMSHMHREALAHLLYGVRHEGGFVLLTGEVGTGKTTICRCLLEQLDTETHVAFILNPKMDVTELLAAICDELSIDYNMNNSDPKVSGASIKHFVDAINNFLLQAHARGEHTVLIIDEAQNLNPEVLEQLRLLTNLETNRKKLLQIILLGQPELRAILARKELRQLAQRITARYHLKELNRAELHSYIRHRIGIAGVQRDIFPSWLIWRIHQLSAGIPRLTNILCDRALLGAYSEHKQFVSLRNINRAAHEIFGHESIMSSRFLLRLPVTTISVIFIMIAVSFSFYYYEDISSFNSKPFTEQIQEKTQTNTINMPTSSVLTRANMQAAWNGDAKLVFNSLAQRWQIILNTDNINNNNNFADFTDICTEARTHGLHCLLTVEARTINKLRDINRPAILHTKNGGILALLAWQDDNNISVHDGHVLRNITLTELAKLITTKNFMLFWQPPANYKHALRSGEQGQDILWLGNSLGVLYPESATILQQEADVFGTVMAATVRRFQHDIGLQEDGIAGSMTLIHLNTRTASNIPLLYTLPD